MSADDVSVQFQGFHPSEFTQTYLDEKLNGLCHKVPNGASVRATFSRHKQNIKGIIRITSAAGEFFAVASGTRLRDVSEKLRLQLNHRLEKWKTRRRKNRRHKEWVEVLA